MPYGELKDYVLQLLDAYSVAGDEVARSYNNQADMLARIPALTRDALYYMATTVRRLRTVARLADPETVEGWQVYQLPDDCYQVTGQLLQCVGGTIRPCGRYRVVGGRQIWLPAREEGEFLLEYFRYPLVPEGEDSDFLDCPPEAQSAVAYYVAAHLAMEDNNNLYALLHNEFERRLARLQEGVQMESEVVYDAYEAS